MPYFLDETALQKIAEAIGAKPDAGFDGELLRDTDFTISGSDFIINNPASLKDGLYKLSYKIPAQNFYTTYGICKIFKYYTNLHVSILGSYNLSDPWKTYAGTGSTSSSTITVSPVASGTKLYKHVLTDQFSHIFCCISLSATPYTEVGTYLLGRLTNDKAFAIGYKIDTLATSEIIISLSYQGSDYLKAYKMDGSSNTTFDSTNYTDTVTAL